MYHFPVRVQYPCFQPFLDEPHQRPVIYTLLQHLYQPCVVYVVKVAFDVRFYHKIVPPILELDRQFVYGVQGPFLGPIPITTSQKVLFVDGFEYPLDRYLQQLIFRRGRTFPSPLGMYCLLTSLAR